ncbi:hypothetical protein RSC2_01505 [Bacillus paralicheniformis]|nr:hypothetical protein RSC1_04049 [Bacillus paralicheniformis]BCE09709.1 hypothetical protein RSC2_01505 [Bacillus paralicheniformis]
MKEENHPCVVYPKKKHHTLKLAFNSYMERMHRQLEP